MIEKAGHLVLFYPKFHCELNGLSTAGEDHYIYPAQLYIYPGWTEKGPAYRVGIGTGHAGLEAVESYSEVMLTQPPPELTSTDVD